MFWLVLLCWLQKWQEHLLLTVPCPLLPASPGPLRAELQLPVVSPPSNLVFINHTFNNFACARVEYVICFPISFSFQTQEVICLGEPTTYSWASLSQAPKGATTKRWCLTQPGHSGQASSRMGYAAVVPLDFGLFILEMVSHQPDLNSWSSCLSLHRSGTMDIHTQLRKSSGG